MDTKSHNHPLEQTSLLIQHQQEQQPPPIADTNYETEYGDLLAVNALMRRIQSKSDLTPMDVVKFNKLHHLQQCLVQDQLNRVHSQPKDESNLFQFDINNSNMDNNKSPSTIGINHNEICSADVHPFSIPNGYSPPINLNPLESSSPNVRIYIPPSIDNEFALEDDSLLSSIPKPKPKSSCCIM